MAKYNRLFPTSLYKIVYENKNEIKKLIKTNAMDFTNIKCINEKCKEKNITMVGAGGSFGGRISIAKVRCPECGIRLMIVPMSDKYEYSISATTEEERIKERIEKAKRESELELAKTILRELSKKDINGV